jgi:CTP:molybdopterin cytidylyltransferase MocA
LSGPQGAKKILEGREGEIQRVPVADRNVFLDIDTQADLAALAALIDDTRS